MSPEQRRARLAHKIQRKWLVMVARGDDKEATVFGQVVDALFDDDGLKAVRVCLRGGVSETLVNEIREIFGV